MNKIATLITAFAKPNCLRANFVSALAMAFAIASCTQSELVHNDHHDLPLTFDTYVGNATETRAGGTLVTSTTLPDGGAFGLFCYMHTDTWATLSTKPNANFMYNQKVEVSTGTTPQTFTYTPVKYWPNNSTDKLSFLAYYPHNGTGIDFEDAANTATPYTPAIANMPKAHFTVQTEAAKQVDFMYADLETDQTKASDKVDFTFRHALTRLQFKAKHSGTGSVEIKITNVTVKAASKGTFDFSNATWTADGTTKANFPLTDYINTVLTTTATDVTTAADKNTLLMIPQDLTDVEIEVTYDQDGDTDNTATLALAGSQSTTPWTANKSITYTLIVNPGNAISFTAEAVAWDSEVEQDLPPKMTINELHDLTIDGKFPPEVILTDTDPSVGTTGTWDMLKAALEAYEADGKTLDLTFKGTPKGEINGKTWTVDGRTYTFNSITAPPTP